jgi:hypothetical protein
MSGSIHDNPALTGDDKRKLIAKYPPHEREARTWGIYEEMAGRLLPDFTTSVHVWDDRLPGADVLIDEKNEPSAMPIGICVDPHPVRPWQITAFAVGPDERWYVVREWPEGDYSCMSHFKAANVDGSFRAYADVIKRMVASIPGADWQTSRRIGWWLMDPAAGDMEAVGQGKTVATAMRDFGLYFRTDKIKRDVAIGEGILRKKIRGTWTPGGPVDYLHRPEFMVALSCPNTWRAAMRYAWDETRNRPGEDGKDQIDVARYFAVTEPLYFDWRFQGQKAEEAMEAHVASMRNMGLG